MKKLTFKQWYAIIFLAVFVVYGWIYLMEHRYQRYEGAFFDTWSQKIILPDKFLDVSE